MNKWITGGLYDGFHLLTCEECYYLEYENFIRPFCTLHKKYVDLNSSCNDMVEDQSNYHIDHPEYTGPLNWTAYAQKESCFSKKYDEKIFGSFEKG